MKVETAQFWLKVTFENYNVNHMWTLDGSRSQALHIITRMATQMVIFCTNLVMSKYLLKHMKEISKPIEPLIHLCIYIKKYKKSMARSSP